MRTAIASPHASFIWWSHWLCYLWPAFRFWDLGMSVRMKLNFTRVRRTSTKLLVQRWLRQKEALAVDLMTFVWCYGIRFLGFPTSLFPVLLALLLHGLEQNGCVFCCTFAAEVACHGYDTCMRRELLRPLPRQWRSLPRQWRSLPRQHNPRPARNL